MRHTTIVLLPWTAELDPFPCVDVEPNMVFSMFLELTRAFISISPARHIHKAYVDVHQPRSYTVYDTLVSSDPSGSTDGLFSRDILVMVTMECAELSGLV